MSAFDALQQLAVGRGMMRVDLHRLVPANASTAPSWAREAVDLRRQRQFETSSRNSVPPEASTNLPVWRSVAPVNALLVAEQDRLDEVIRDRAAIDRNERFDLRPPLPWMARANNSFAGFSFDQHRIVELCCAQPKMVFRKAGEGQ